MPSRRCDPSPIDAGHAICIDLTKSEPSEPKVPCHVSSGVGTGGAGGLGSTNRDSGYAFGRGTSRVPGSAMGRQSDVSSLAKCDPLPRDDLIFRDLEGFVMFYENGMKAPERMSTVKSQGLTSMCVKPAATNNRLNRLKPQQRTQLFIRR